MTSDEVGAAAGTTVGLIVAGLRAPALAGRILPSGNVLTKGAVVVGQMAEATAIGAGVGAIVTIADKNIKTNNKKWQLD
jgi:hypothetical protein